MGLIYLEPPERPLLINARTKDDNFSIASGKLQSLMQQQKPILTDIPQPLSTPKFIVKSRCSGPIATDASEMGTVVIYHDRA